MSQDARSVLTAEEWAEMRYELLSDDTLVIHDDGDGLEVVVYDSATARAARGEVRDKRKLAAWAPEDHAALAALALQRAGADGGPLFTSEMVDALEECAVHAEGYIIDRALGATAEKAMRQVAVAADAIAVLRSLLPPRMEP